MSKKQEVINWVRHRRRKILLDEIDSHKKAIAHFDKEIYRLYKEEQRERNVEH